MVEPTSPSFNQQSNFKSHFTWSIGITGVLVLFLIVLAIVIPEYLKYCFQMKQVEVQNKQIDFQQAQEKKRDEARTALASPPVPPQPPPVKTDSAPSSPSSAPLDISAKTSTGASESKITPVSMDSSSLFDSYGRFLTLLVGLLSVLGLFFGYFVRKSIHETEENMEAKIDKILSNWKEEKAQIKEIYKSQSDELNLKLGEVGSLKTEVEALKLRLTEYLDDYRKSKQDYTEGPAQPIQDPTLVADALDREFSSESQASSKPEDIEEK